MTSVSQELVLSEDAKLTLLVEQISVYGTNFLKLCNCF